MKDLEKFKNLGEILSKAQQKKILGGYGGDGDIEYSLNGAQYGCGLSSLSACTEQCETFAEEHGEICEGCAQFP